MLWCGKKGDVLKYGKSDGMSWSDEDATEAELCDEVERNETARRNRVSFSALQQSNYQAFAQMA